jgi:hypothetical protein
MTDFTMKDYEEYKKHQEKLMLGKSELEQLIVSTVVKKGVAPLSLFRTEPIGDFGNGRGLRFFVKSDEFFPVFELAYDLWVPREKESGNKKINVQVEYKKFDGHPPQEYIASVADKPTDFNNLARQIAFLKSIDDAVRTYKSKTLEVCLFDNRDYDHGFREGYIVNSITMTPPAKEK